MRYIIGFFFTLFLFVFSGCTEEPSVPTSMQINVVSSGNPTPVALYFFALDSDERFRRMDYVELMRAKQTKLEGDILIQDKKILPVGGKISKTFRLPPNTRYFGVVASFSDVDNSDNWRKIQGVGNGINNMTLYIGNNEIRQEY